jgi:hypothetical protein
MAEFNWELFEYAVDSATHANWQQLHPQNSANLIMLYIKRVNWHEYGPRLESRKVVIRKLLDKGVSILHQDANGLIAPDYTRNSRLRDFLTRLIESENHQ